MFSDILFLYLTSFSLMSSADPHYLDAKNRSKNTTNARHSELAKNPEFIGNGSFVSQDDRYRKHSHVMCFGTFDIFHPGHQYYLSQAQELAEKMSVVIARDHRVFSGKGQDPVHTELLRRDIVERAFPDAHVILGNESDIFAPIRELSPDVLAFGYDQRVPEAKIHELFPHIQIVRISGYETEKWKSSILRDEHIERHYKK